MKKTRNNTSKPVGENATLLHVAIILLLPSLLYFKTIDFGFIQFDDTGIIVDNYQIIGNIRNLPEAFRRDAFVSRTGSSFYRPIQTVTYMFDALVSGDQPWMYHLSNILIHIGTSLSLYLLLRILRLRTLTAFLCALIFSIHPLLTAAVSWIPARGDLLIGFFGIWLLITFERYCIHEKTVLLLVHAALFLLALFTKETAVLLPVLLMFFSMFVIQRERSFRFLLPVIFAWLTMSLIFFFMRALVLQSDRSPETFGMTSFLQNISTIPTIIGKFFLPFELTTMPLFDTTSLVIGLVIMSPGTFWIVSAYTKKNWLFLTGVLWFFLFITPPMFYRLPYADYLFTYFEHRMYLPVIGLLLGAGTMTDHYLSPKNRLVFFLGASLFIAAFSYQASVHCNDFKDSQTFFTSAIDRNPLNAAAYTGRGAVYGETGKMQDALDDFDKAIAICNFPGAYYNRGYLKTLQGDHAAAEKDYSFAIAFDPGFTKAYVNRAIGKEYSREYTSALSDLERAEQLEPQNETIPYNRGNILADQQEYREAIKQYSRAITLKPSYVKALINRGVAKYRVSDFDGALTDYQQAAQFNTNLEQVYNNMGVAYRELGRFDKALEYFSSALRMDSLHASTYYNKGIVELRLKIFSQACLDLKRAVHLGYAPAMDTLRRYCP